MAGSMRAPPIHHPLEDLDSTTRVVVVYRVTTVDMLMNKIGNKAADDTRRLKSKSGTLWISMLQASMTLLRTR
jgi:hypothetical protein